MDLYSIVIYILRRFPGLSIYSCAAVEIMDTPLPPTQLPDQPQTLQSET